MKHQSRLQLHIRESNNGYIVTIPSERIDTGSSLETVTTPEEFVFHDMVQVINFVHVWFNTDERQRTSDQGVPEESYIDPKPPN